MIARDLLATLVAVLEADAQLRERLRAALGVGAAPPTPVGNSEYSTMTQFADRLGVSRRHVADLRAGGQLVTVGSGRALRVDVVASVDRLRRQTLPGPDVINIDARRRARAAASKITRR